MKYSIGLDLGINNVGWAIYDIEKQQIIEKGVARYEKSNDAKDRRALRSSRRLKKRKLHRVERLALFLEQINFITPRTYEPDLLLKRIKGLNESLTKQEIVNILYYFCIHRGYIPFDEETTERDVHTFKNDEYPCMYLKEYLDKYGVYRGACDLILMSDNIRELRAILIQQQKYYSELTSVHIEKILDIIQMKRKFWEGPGSPRIDHLTPYGRYRNIEDLRKYEINNDYNKFLYEILIGECDLSINQLGQKEKVCAKCNFYAEKFNFLNDFINIRVKSPTNIDSSNIDKINFNDGKLTKKAIEEIMDLAINAKTFKLEDILKKVLGVELNDIQGYRVDKNNKPEMSNFEFYKYFKKQFASINPTWINYLKPETYNKVIHVLTVAPSLYAIPEILESRIPEIKFSEEEIIILQNIKKKKAADLGYHSLSENLLKKSISDMQKFEYQYNFMQVMKKLDYEKTMNEYFQNNYTKQTKELYLVEAKYINDLIANPQVKKTLKKAIKIINEIILTIDNYPEAIIIESTKDQLNSEAKRKEIIKEQALLEKLNKNACEILESNGLLVNSKNIDKITAWLETNRKCAYCYEKEVNINEALSLDIEHILPRSKTFDNSFNNRTCACEKCNKEKGNRTPYEYLTSKNKFDEFKKRVELDFKTMSQEKKNNLLFTLDLDKYSIKFINRNLSDTGYATRALIEELNKYNLYLYEHTSNKIKLVSAPGQLTAKLRKDMEISKDRDFNYHHAIDAMILASLINTRIGGILLESQNDNKYWLKQDTKKEEYRDKIVNMISSVHLANKSEIKEFYELCQNSIDEEKDTHMKMSFEVSKQPLRKFADSSYSKLIKKDDNYYIINQINNIYDLTESDKKILKDAFNESSHTKELLCQEKDPKLFNMLKEIYLEFNKSDQPFKDSCIYEKGLEQKEFNYRLDGIRKQNKPNSPVVISLRYLERVTNPYIKKDVSTKKNNKNGEFINSNIKPTNLLTMTSLKQICTEIYYSKTNNKFIFIPIYAITMGLNKDYKNDEYYQATYQRLTKNQEIIRIGEVYNGEIIGSYNKNGEYKEGKYKGYHKVANKLEFYLNGFNNKTPIKSVNTTDQRIIIYSTNILGKKYIRLDTKDYI